MIHTLLLTPSAVQFLATTNFQHKTLPPYAAITIRHCCRQTKLKYITVQQHNVQLSFFLQWKTTCAGRRVAVLGLVAFSVQTVVTPAAFAPTSATIMATTSHLILYAVPTVSTIKIDANWTGLHVNPTPTSLLCIMENAVRILSSSAHAVVLCTVLNNSLFIL